MNTVTLNDLSPDQRDAYNSIVGWMDEARGDYDDFDDEDNDVEIEPSRVLTLGGYAGTGKSTLVSLIASRVELPAFCAYTGKASSVLKRKLAKAGIVTVGTQKSRDGMRSNDPRPYCGTIHSLIYAPCTCREPQVKQISKTCPAEKCGEETTWSDGRSTCVNGHVGLAKTPVAFEKLGPSERFVYAKKNEDGSCAFCGGKEWLRRASLDRRYGLIIVDEASMVDDTMLRDLRSYGVPILAVGDHGQLPPVGGVGSLMKAPQLRLEKIHRQAEGNPIIALSKIIRETGRLPDSIDGEEVRFGKLRFVEQLLEERYGDASPERLLEMGLACYTNRRRVGLNIAVRRARGTARVGRELPVKGEHLVCLRNMKASKGMPPIYNGMRGVLETNAPPKLVKDAHGTFKNERGENARESEIHLTGEIAFPDDGIGAYGFTMFRPQLNREKTFSAPEEMQRETGVSPFNAAGALFDFGFAMTAHKMQGSQYSDLVVVVERPGPVSDEDFRRWLYTAITRSEKRLTVLR